jgi:hypothetical protein
MKPTHVQQIKQDFMQLSVIWGEGQLSCSNQITMAERELTFEVVEIISFKSLCSVLTIAKG